MEAETTAITSYLEYTKPFALIDLHGDGNKIVLPDAQIGSNKYRSTKHLSLPTISLRRGLMKEFNYTYERGTNKEVNGISLEGSAINFVFHKFNTPFSVAIHMFKTPASMNRPNFEQQFLVYQDQVNFVFNHIINATLNYTGSEWSYESSGVGTTNIWWSFTISLTVLLTFHLIF
uniref:Transmembrane protein 231 n=1 Tax=Rhabditophanes sp. KR3021 TaxID=114890 RepID=A0AC35TMY5_9BILA